jgi:uncharacterized membrane protein
MNHGFLRAADGTITRLDIAEDVSTEPNVINDEGVIAGGYMDSKGIRRGFVRRRNGTIKTFHVGDTSETQTYAINTHGEVAGLYFVGARTIHAFLFNP